MDVSELFMAIMEQTCLLIIPDYALNIRTLISLWDEGPVNVHKLKLDLNISFFV